jgi:hypothetical protein
MDDTLFYLVRNGQRGVSGTALCAAPFALDRAFPRLVPAMQMNVQIGRGTEALHERDRTL